MPRKRLVRNLLALLACLSIAACSSTPETGIGADTSPIEPDLSLDGSTEDVAGDGISEVIGDSPAPEDVQTNWDASLNDAPPLVDSESLDVTPTDNVDDDTSSPKDTSDNDAPTPDGESTVDVFADDVGPDTPKGFFGKCFTDKQDPNQPGPNYDQYVFTAASHCKGTNHQIITNVERVVFMGDSVTVGTPNGEHLLSVDNEHFYRNQLAEWLAKEFKLDKGEPFLEWNQWKAYDYGSGKGSKKTSGDFAHCAKWGGRCDDLLDQSESCFKGNTKNKRTLTVFTVGGNDVAKLTQVGGDASDEEVAAGYPKAWKVAEEAVADLEEAVKWLKDPANFPNGSYVVFGTPFEFTDGTGKVDACTPETTIKVPGIGVIDLTELNLNVAALAGYQEWKEPGVQRQIVIWMLEEFLRIAATYKADMIWMAESFCGHGYVAAGPNADPNNACYEGPDSELWFDETCTHPSPAGHAALYDMFRAVIEE